eukprot:s1542_g20.t2
MLCRARDRRGGPRALLAGAAGAWLLYHKSLDGHSAPVNFTSVSAPAPKFGCARPGVSQRLSTSRPRLDLRSRRGEHVAILQRGPALSALLGLCLGIVVLFSGAKVAAAAGATRPHLGVRLAMKMKACCAIPDWAILVLLSALPLVELRGGVPVGLWMGLAVPQVMLLCILGNMIPIPLLLAALRTERIKKLLTPLLDRAAQKTEPIGAHDRWVGIAAFVGVPLPGTGAWTGAMVAYLLGMGLGEAITSVLAGVIVAACIMASLTLAGWYGCAVAQISRNFRSDAAALPHGDHETNRDLCNQKCPSPSHLLRCIHRDTKLCSCTGQSCMQGRHRKRLGMAVELKAFSQENYKGSNKGEAAQSEALLRETTVSSAVSGAIGCILTRARSTDIAECLASSFTTGRDGLTFWQDVMMRGALLSGLSKVLLEPPYGDDIETSCAGLAKAGFLQEIHTSKLTDLTEQCRVDAEKAKASVEADADAIKKHIQEKHQSFGYVNETVERALWCEVIAFLEQKDQSTATEEPSQEQSERKTQSIDASHPCSKMRWLRPRRSRALCVLALCFCLSRPYQALRREAIQCVVGAAENSRRQSLSGDELDQPEEDTQQTRPQGVSAGRSGEGAMARERRRDIRTPPVVEDIIAGALVGAVTGAVAGAGSGAALGSAGTTGLAGAAGGAASGAALGLTSGAVAGAALATANPDVAAAGVGAAGIGAAAGVAAVLNRVQIVRQDQYGQWPPPPVVPQFMDRPSMTPDPILRNQNLSPQAPVVPEPEPVPETPPAPPARADTATETAASPGPEVQEVTPPSSSKPEQSLSGEPQTVDAPKDKVPMHKGWKRANTVSLRRASDMLSAEIEATSGEVVAKGLETIGILLSHLQQMQVACQAAITKATEDALQRARSLGLKSKSREGVGDDM